MLLRKGYAVMRALRDAGIKYETHRKWMQRGAGGEEPYAAYYVAVNDARSDMVLTAAETLDEVMRYSDNDRTRLDAAKFVLERRGGWVPRAEVQADVQVEGKVDVGVEVSQVDRVLTPEVVQAMTPNQVQAALATLLTGGGDTTPE